MLITTNALGTYITCLRALNAARQRVDELTILLGAASSSQELSQAWADYRQARQAAEDAWQHLPEPYRHTLKPLHQEE